MNRDAYNSQTHPHPRGGSTDLALLIHNAVAHVAIPIGWRAGGNLAMVASMTHIRQDMLRSTDPLLLDNFSRQLRRTETFLRNGVAIDNYTPNDDDVRQLFSMAFHILNPDNPVGQAHRVVFEKALQVLEVGGILPDRSLLRSDPATRGSDLPGH